MNPLDEPDAVTVKKQITVVACIVGVALFVYLLFNVVRTFHSIKNSSTPQKVAPPVVASTTDTDWYKTASIPQKTISPPPINPPLPAKPNDSPAMVSVNNESPTVSSEETDQNKAIDEQTLKDMAAPITSNQLTFDLKEDGNNSGQQTKVGQSLRSTTLPSLSADSGDQNKQGEKQAFVKTAGDSDIYLDSSVETPRSQLELQAGTIIPGILIQGINSDLPSTIKGQVTENVYDSITGGQVLIPQGSTLTGVYDSQIAYGQERVLAVWQRVIFPNGKSIDLKGMPGVDISGYGGFHDQVDNHYWKITKSVLLVSVLSMGAQLSQPQQTSENDNGYLTINQQLAQNLGTNISNAGTELFEKDINIQPTLEIRQGYQFNIMITKDIVFDEAYQD